MTLPKENFPVTEKIAFEHRQENEIAGYIAIKILYADLKMSFRQITVAKRSYR